LLPGSIRIAATERTLVQPDATANQLARRTNPPPACADLPTAVCSLAAERTHLPTWQENSLSKFFTYFGFVFAKTLFRSLAWPVRALSKRTAYVGFVSPKCLF
jgi:hypothetical protein